MNPYSSITDQLHDKSLVEVQVEWVTSRAELRFSVDQDRTIVIRAEDFLLIEVPQRNSWGPSVSVMHVEIERLAKIECDQCQVQMQSGDVVVIQALQISAFEERGAPDRERDPAK